jgi:hypothetical protein
VYAPAALLDLHERTHRNLSALLDHCRALDDEHLNRELAGFGYPTIDTLVPTAGLPDGWAGSSPRLMLAKAPAVGARDRRHMPQRQ